MNAFGIGRWTGTNCLICQDILERCEWYDEQFIRRTCTLECHMAWHIYQQILAGKDPLTAAQKIFNKYEGYPFSEKDNLTKTQLMVEKDQEFEFPIDECIWNWKMQQI